MKKGSTSPLFRVGWIFEPLHDKDWLNQRYLHYTDQQFNTYMISSIYCDDVWQITKWKITFQNDLPRHIQTLMSYMIFPSLYKLIYYLYFEPIVLIQIAMRAKTTFPAVISYWKGIETKMIWWACTTIMLAKVSPYEIFISKRYTKDLFIYHSWIKKHIYRAVSVQTNV